MPDQPTPAPIDCTTAMRRLWAYLDDALDAADAAAVREHVAECAECRAHTEFERALLASIAEAGERYDDVEALRGEVLARLRAAGL